MVSEAFHDGPVETPQRRASKLRLTVVCAAACAAVLTGLRLAFPLFAHVTKFVLPLPLAVLYLLLGPPLALSALLGVCAVLWVILSWEPAFTFLAEGVLVAIVLGEHVRRHLSPTKTIAVGVLTVSLATLLLLATSRPGVLTGTDEKEFRAMLRYSGGTNAAQPLDQIKESFGEKEAGLLIRYMMLSTPALIVVGQLVYIIVGFWAFRALIRRLFGPTVARILPTEDFKIWHAPDHLIFALIASGFVMLGTHGLLAQIALNVLIVVGVVYFIQGLAVGSFFLDRLKVARTFQWLALLIVFLLIKVLFIVLTGLGVVDVFVDFRKIRPKHTPIKQEGS